MRRILFAFVLLLVLPLHAQAQSGASWTVQKITGLAYIAQKGEKAIKVRKGSVLHPGQTLSTKNRTRLLLIRGKERMQVGPDAIMAIPPAKYIQSGKTVILQQSGRIQLTVNKQDVKHFSVKTPYLTAVVKGTVFTVDVAQNRAEVSVNRGRVEVSDGATGNTTEITRGQKASVTKAASGKTNMTVQAKGKKPTIKQIKSKITKPNFYATVQVKGKTRALKAGSKTATTSVEEARSELSSSTSSASANGNSGNGRGTSSASSSFSSSSDDDNDHSRNSASSSHANAASKQSNAGGNGLSNNGKSNANSNASSNNGKSNANSNASSNNGKSNTNSNASSNNGKSNANSNASSNNGKSNANSNASSNNGKSGKNK
ncbi:FecR family protein [Cohaesibacter marisflavi]|uniref:FecR family protein n=1 Tax=Cohaesibacter marisflavi TaxID=655353 RepID=UPI0029C99FA0|nr:FecR family protein [Cohaesibacter marisflavi]